MLFFSFIPLHIAAKINIISDSHSIVLFIFSFIIEEMAFCGSSRKKIRQNKLKQVLFECFEFCRDSTDKTN